MKILVHALAMRKQGGGSRHLHGFISALGDLDTENQYFIYLDRRFPFAVSHPNIHVRPVRVASQIHRLWWDQVLIPRIVRRQRIDLVLAIFVFGSFKPPCPQVVFQRNQLYFCGEYLSQLRPWSKWRGELWLRRQMAYLTMRASRAIVVPTLAMREMIRAYFPHLPQEHFVVLPHAFELSHFLKTQPLEADLQAQIAAIPTGTPKLLYVSHLEPHKGFEILLAGVRELARRQVDFRLLTTMDPRDGKAQFSRLQEFIGTHGLRDRLLNLGRVPEDQVHHLYRQADLFVFPSLCESFGFPMKEALAMGLPSIAAGTAVNREICGPAALYYPPRDPQALADAVQRLLESPAERTCLSQKASEHFSRTTLDWQTYVTRLLGLIRNTVCQGAECW